MFGQLVDEFLKKRKQIPEQIIEKIENFEDNGRIIGILINLKKPIPKKTILNNKTKKENT